MNSTQKSFSFEWNRYHILRPDRDMRYVLEGGLTPEFFKGKEILDVGCGYGRHIKVIAPWAKKIIGIDFSDSYLIAKAKTKGMKNVEVLQADIFKLLFEPATFGIPYMDKFFKCFIKLDIDPSIARTDTFDWYHPKYQFHFKESEIVSWFKENGFDNIIACGSEGVRGQLI